MNQLIKIFLTIEEHKSISEAARVLHYSQPAISAYLTQLEKKLGVQLVHRTRGKREVALTPAGEAFVPLARRFLDLDKQLDQYIKSQQQRVIRLAASANAHDYVVSHIISKLVRFDPDVEIRLSTVEIREMERAISDRAFDVALMYGVTPQHPHIRTIPLFREERCILCPINTPLPDRVISPLELDRKFEVTHATYTNPIVAEWHEKWFPKDAKPFFIISSLMACVNYMADPQCWALLPYGVANRLRSLHPNEVTIRRVDPVPAPRSCSALVLETYSDEKTIQNLLRSVDEYIEERPFLKKAR